MEAKFTPGPWAIDGYHTSAVIARVGGKWQRIADTDFGDFGTNANWRADALAIAALPEIIDAMRLLIEAAAAAGPMITGQAAGTAEALGDAINNARSALSRVEQTGK